MIPFDASKTRWMERLPSGAPLLAAMLVVAHITMPARTGAQQPDRRQQTRIDEALRREGDAVVELVEAAMNGRAVPSDFAMEWRNDYLKAQPGTFVPFTISIDSSIRATPGALMYVRVVDNTTIGSKRRGTPTYSYETIFPVDVDADAGAAAPVRVQRGFAVPAGSYTVYAALRERPSDLLERRNGKRRAGVLVQRLDVPDFWIGELTTSTVILADRVETLAAPIPPSQLEENPYVVGSSRIYPSSGARFGRERELIVVFLIYNPQVGTDKHFDLQVDYHLYRKNREGERYVTRTNPQRFTPSVMGPHFDPGSGQPVLAGQGILLSEFEAGDYRLGITVTDLLARKTVTRNVAFTVTGS